MAKSAKLKNNDTFEGFTLVELLIVIVVIAILAAVSVVAYNGVQDRARNAQIDSMLDQVKKKLALYHVENDHYPTDLATVDIDDAQYEYVPNAQAAPTSYCLSYSQQSKSKYTTPIGNTSTGSCSDGNTMAGWTLNGGIDFDASRNVFSHGTSTGTVTSPFIPNNGASNTRIQVEARASQPSPNRTPDGGVYFGTEYYAADKVTRVANTGGHIGNGYASCTLPLNTWTTCTWTPATGPDISYIRFVIRSNPGVYTGANEYRNISLGL